MSTIRKHGDKWQSLVRISGHPQLAKSFASKTDERQLAISTELKIMREDAGVLKIKYPYFKDIALRYINEVSTTKRSFKKERYLIMALMNESWAEYPIDKIKPAIIAKYRDKKANSISGSSINRSLDAISTIFTQCKKEWGYPVDNPVLSIRRPKKAAPRNRRFSDAEIHKLVKGNRTSEVMRTLIQIALETGMRVGEIKNISHDHLKDSTLYIPVAKTEPRTIPLTPRAVTLIKNAKLPFKLSVDAIGKQFKRLCKHYGIKGAVFHDLRHQSLSNFMLHRKLNVGETMLVAGHKDPRMLLRIYNNLKVADVAKKLT